MNKLINPVPSGGFPFTVDDAIRIEYELHAAIGALANGIDASGFVISGCTATVSGSTLIISNGFVYLDGQYMRFGGYTGSYPAYVKAGTPTKTQRIYGDGFSKDATIETFAVVTTSQPGSGSYITFNPQPNKVLKTSITGSVDARLTQEITDRTNGDNVLSGRIDSEVGTLNSAIALKANKVQPVWQNIVFSNNSGSSFTADTSSSFRQTPQYMKDEFGFVHLRGHVNSTNQPTFFWTPPAGYKPPKDVFINVSYPNATIVQSGRLYFSGNEFTYGSTNTANHIFSLDGISYYVG
ncbi:hypothetical protein [Rufibacter ruber]|uniref:hypothetical protein n=1 Tax=Rufibacter ruber TaxID=1783499 RepID=UPI0008301382|nr:hypothetical protein [Rufibacter ruber]